MTSTAMCFGELGESRSYRPTLTPIQWTCVGALAIPLWATWPSLATRMSSLPALEILTIMFLFGWITLSLLDRTSRQSTNRATRLWWVPGLVYACATSVGDVCFLLATRRIPPAQANLILYLWPVMIVMMGAGAGLFRLKTRQILGLALGFTGAAILLWDGHVGYSLGGIALALLAGALWAGYCVFRLIWKGPTGNLLTHGCAISTVVCGLLHLLFEPTVIPSSSALAASAIAGVFPLAIGNYVWDHGFRRGDGQLLAVMAYATPLCSALLLSALGLALLTWNLLAGAVVIVLAGVLSRAVSMPVDEKQ